MKQGPDNAGHKAVSNYKVITLLSRKQQIHTDIVFFSSTTSRVELVSAHNEFPRAGDAINLLLNIAIAYATSILLFPVSLVWFLPSCFQGLTPPCCLAQTLHVFTRILLRASNCWCISTAKISGGEDNVHLCFTGGKSLVKRGRCLRVEWARHYAVPEYTHLPQCEWFKMSVPLPIR
jgi:hypothetical protein